MKVQIRPPSTDLRLMSERRWQDWKGWKPTAYVAWTLCFLELIF